MPTAPPPESLPPALGYDVETGRPFRLPDRDRGSVYILGVPGTGKSNVLANLALQSARSGASMLVIDPHASVTDYLLYSLPEERHEDIVAVDFTDRAYAVGSNFFEYKNHSDDLELARVMSAGVHIFELQSRLDNLVSWGPRMAQLFRMSIGTLAMMDLTMTEFLPLLLDTEFRERIVARLPIGEIRAFWEKEFRNLKGATGEVIGPVTNKVRPWVDLSLTRRILGQAKSTLGVPALREEGKIILMPLPAGVLGRDVASLLGASVMSQVLNSVLALQEDPRRSRRPLHVFVDEFQLVASRDVEELVTEGRKFAVEVVAAHQVRDQLPDTSRQATLAMQNQFYGRITGKDAAEIAQNLDRRPPQVTPQVEYTRWGTRSLPVHIRTYADIGGERANDLVTLDPYEFYVRTRNGGEYFQGKIRVEPAPRWDQEPTPKQRARAEEIRSRSRERYARPVGDVDREIAARLTVEKPSPVVLADETPQGPIPPRRVKRS